MRTRMNRVSDPATNKQNKRIANREEYFASNVEYAQGNGNG